MKNDYTKKERYDLARRLHDIYERVHLIADDDFDYEQAQDDLETAIGLISPEYADDWDEQEESDANEAWDAITAPDFDPLDYV